MRFASPEWFLLVPLLVLLGWFWQGLRLASPLRAATLLLIVLMLARPQIRRFADGLDLWVLVDRSDSAAPLLQPVITEWESILERSKGAADRVHHVDFALEAARRGVGDAKVFSGKTTRTQLATALRFSLAQMESDRAARLLVLTDGHSTEPLAGLGERLIKQDVAMDWRILGTSPAGDWRIQRLALPRRAQLGEPVLIEVQVTGEGDAKLPVQVLRNGRPIGKGEVTIMRGKGSLRFTDRLSAPGAHRYEAIISAANDPSPDNNRATQWLEIESGPRVLLLTSYASDPLEQVLRAQGFEVEVIMETAALDAGRLSGAKLVILNNVPAYQLNNEFMKSLDFFVNHQAGGLLMTGGKFSFGAGGYFGSAVDDLLPVSMELKQEHRKLAVALAIVLDRSGSMAASVGGSGLQKMDLANAGAARAIELLGEMDFASVFAVDSSAHEIAPLIPVRDNRVQLADACRRVQSAGGGIFVYTGLEAAWKVLKPAQVGQRHVILFADAADAEEPGKYKELLAEMAKEKATVSVIGMGSDTDTDAAFLKDVAKLGGGRIFFNANPTELPALFAQETVAVARSAFIKEPTQVNGQAGWLELAARPMAWLPQVDGYNLSYLKPGATQAAVTGDEYAAPLVAFWQRGAGRAAAISFPLGGGHTERVRQWPQFGDLVLSTTRWLMGEKIPPGLGLKTRVEGTELRADLFYDDAWTDKISRDAPRLSISRGETAKVEDIAWERLSPGHYRAAIPIEGDEWMRGAVAIGKTAMPFGPVNAVVNPEWDFDLARVEELKHIARQSGGVERTDLSDVWRAPRPEAWSDLTRWLAIALIILVLLEALQTRTGYGLRSRA
jgi:hypothetical protein